MRILFFFVIALTLSSHVGFSQAITVSSETGGLSGTTQVAGTTNVAFFGIEFAKAGGGASSLTGFTIDLDQDATSTFTNVRLYRSDNNSSFDGADLGNLVSTGTVTTNSIVFTEAPGTITTFSGSSGAASRIYFVLVDVIAGTPTLTITPSLTEADVIAGSTVNAFSLTGTAYTFQEATINIGSLNSVASNGVASTPLIAGTTGKAVFGFSLNSNSTQIVSDIDLQVTSTVASKLSNFSLIRSTDNSFSTTGNNTTIGSATIDASAGTTISISGLSESISTSTKNYFLVADVDASVTSASTGVTISIANSDVTVDDGAVSGNATGAAYSFEELATSINQLTGGVAGSPLSGGASEQAILGFSISSNGAVTLSALDVLVTSNPSSFSSAKLYSSADNSFGSDAEIIDPSGYTVTFNADRISFANMSQAISSTIKYYFVVVDISNSANSGTPTLRPSFTNANITISGGGTVNVTPTPLNGTIYSFADTTPPDGTYATVGASPNVSVLGDITLTYNEPARKTDGTILTDSDLAALVVLKETNGAGVDVPFTATVTTNATSTIVTINPTNPLKGSQLYYVQMSAVEDAFGNEAVAAESHTFTTEPPPSFLAGAFSPSATCIGDNITVAGSNFGVAIPTVIVNGVNATIVTNSNTSITFTALAGMAGTSVTVQITNNTNSLSTTVNTSLTIHPAIDQTLAVNPLQGGQITLNPAQNTSVDLTVENSQGGFTYTYYLISQAPGYGKTLPFNLGTDVGTGADISESTTSLTRLGSYQYRIDVSRTGCTTQSLTTQPILTVQELSVTVSATETTICDGQPTTLIGSTSGGTGFYKFEWTSTPVGYASTSSSPTVIPPTTLPSITYNLKVTDNEGNFKTGSVVITLNDNPTAQFEPAPTESAVRTKYVIENRDYQLYGSPAGGEFTGQGVIKKADNNYYFNPASAGVGTWTITYSYTAPSGCTGTDTESFQVTNTNVNGLEPLYCRNAATDSGLSPTATAVKPGFQFTRLRFFKNGLYYDDATTNPLTVTGFGNVVDIQTGLNVAIPTSYSLDINKIYTVHGNGSYYIDVFGKDALGTEQLQSFQFFSVVELGIKPTITGIPSVNVCSDITPITLGSSISNYAITNFSISQYPTSLSGPKNETFTPSAAALFGSGQDELPLTITMVYKDLNNCTETTQTSFNWVKKPNAPFANDTSFCQFEKPPFYIKARPNGSADNAFWYASTDPSTPIEKSTLIFPVPNVDGQTTVTRSFLVTQSYRGCEGNSRAVSIEIKPAPDASFTTPAICQNRKFSVTGAVDANNGNQPYESYEWSFGDRGTATGQTVSYTYTNLNQYDIRLQVTTSEGCVNSEVRQITVGENPKPTFTFNQLCEGDKTQFNASANLAVQKYSWEFGDTKTIAPGNELATVPAPDEGTYKNPRHQFPITATDDVVSYNVLLRSFTATGCYDSIFKTVTIIPYLKTYTKDAPYIMAEVDSEKGFWSVENTKQPENSSWEFGAPAKTIIANTSNAWVTNIAGEYNSGDVSYLNSPCLDISNFTKPAISFDYISVLEKGYDGAVLEYSSNGGVTWLALGDLTSGNNWFNTQGFTSNIGSSQIGWSDTIRGPGNAWLEGKHKLDDIPNKTKVRFRFAFASNDEKSYEGFAFTNLKIEDRNRIMLLENFTNQSDPDYQDDQEGYLNITNPEVIKMQYHLGYPGADPIFEQNSADPTARAAYYGIANTQNLIPRAYVDGQSGGNLIGNWSTQKFLRRTLDTSPFTLDVSTLPAGPSHIQVQMTINPIQNVPTVGQTTPNLVAHFALVQKTVGSNKYVVRKLIPNAIGTPIALPLLKDVPYTVQPEPWLVNVSGMDLSDLAIIGFVQDIDTKEVYQSFVLADPTNLPTVVTGVEPLEISGIQMYPNPVDNELQVELADNASADIQIQIFDISGRVIHQTSLMRGEKSKALNFRELNGGAYIIEFKNTKGIIRRKVMVIHE